MTYNLENKNLTAILLTSIILTLFCPSSKLMFFGPPLIILYYQRPLIHCLAWAIGLGLCMDLLSSYNRFGITALNYFLCTLLLYPQKKHFFSDRLSTLPIMTFLFTAFSLILHAQSQLISLSWGWIATDLLLMPLGDALCAFLLYIAPPLLLGKRVRKGKDYFLT
jgi:hypothetical protein